MKGIKPPKYTHAFVDRYGTRRYYLRLPGRKRVPLPGEPWTPEFMAAREQAMKSDWVPPELGASRTRAGTVNAALVSYYQSSGFGTLGSGTKTSRRAVLENFRKVYGDRPVGTLPKKALQVIIDKKSPASQRNFKKAMRGFINHAMSLEMVTVDPMAGLKLAKMKSDGIHTWTEDEVLQFETHHPIGTKPRLAMELLLSTGHARADVVRMGRQHIRNGVLSMRRQKTKVPFEIPILPQLVAEIDRIPASNHMTFLVTQQGKPFTAAGFGGWFRDRCDEAGLPQCSAHGLRKAAAVRHALNGATGPELMAWFAWKSISEAQRYIEAANRLTLSRSTGAKLISRTTIGKP
jgi:integrase